MSITRSGICTFLLTACLLLATFVAFAQSDREKTDKKLQARLQQLVKDFRGDVGIYVHHLRTGQTAAINADTLFPTASMIKFPIMVGLFDKINQGALDYHGVLTYRDSLLYPGEDILGAFKDSSRIPLSQVVMLMITTSDNTASLWSQYLAGTGTSINGWLAQNGYQSTRVNSRTPGRQADRNKYGWGQTTPREMARLLAAIRQGRVINPEASERMYRNLTRIYWDDQALSQIPPYVQAVSKQGMVDQSRSEVVLVNAPHGDYVFCVITKNQADTSWERNNAGYVLLRQVSGLLWSYFESKSDWQPALKPAKWY